MTDKELMAIVYEVTADASIGVDYAVEYAERAARAVRDRMRGKTVPTREQRKARR